jgi:hypothetical protein
MNAPTSSILAETYIQQIGHKHIYSIKKKQQQTTNKQIIAYFRYVEDIMYYQTKKQTLNKRI